MEHGRDRRRRRGGPPLLVPRGRAARREGLRVELRLRADPDGVPCHRDLGGPATGILQADLAARDRCVRPRRAQPRGHAADARSPRRGRGVRLLDRGQNRHAGRRLRVRGVERVQDVPAGDRARDDREVIAEVDHAVVLHRDVRDVRPREEAAGVRAHQLVVARGQIGVHDTARRCARLDRVDVVGADDELLARAARARDRVGCTREERAVVGGERADTVEGRAVLDARHADVARDLRGAAEVLEVVVGHRRTFGMTHDVDLAGAGRREDLIDERGQLRRALLHRCEATELRQCRRRVGIVAVGQREHAVTVVREQRRHRLPIVGHVREQAVHEHDGPRVRSCRPARPVVRPRRRCPRLERGGQHVRRERVRHGVLLGRGRTRGCERRGDEQCRERAGEAAGRAMHRERPPSPATRWRRAGRYLPTAALPYASRWGAS